ncbi:YeeE/YedE family protein [Shimia sp. R10_1]|uniref:YeeE/YedE family protein n=1 Tax=Shimia sp. R10_1 TaxID=2821095 RepID=UPI001ADA84B1|nr:YeeE/YedE thiosulfate transporter family protein [Shimia sp. R10_1]MBO9473279.1 YeeE/YedE family protein [Shimia sp. R10_1]
MFETLPSDWLWGLTGGFLIGTGGAVFLLANGRIMGASGILGGLIDGSGRSNWGERVAFLLGVFALPLLLLPATDAVDTHATTNLPILIAAGLCVGIGTRMANGCTSGHGVCGISRLSLRGIVATVFYILAGGLTVALFRHLLGVI